MRQPLRKFRKLSDGERARGVAFVLVGLSSAGLGYLAVLHLDRGALFNELSWYQAWMIIAAGLGGLIALFLSGDRMGQAGPRGAVSGVAGAIWLTFVGTLVGGTLALPFYGTMFGPFIVMVTFLGAPMLAMLWVFNLIGIHLLLGLFQRERDTIFKRRQTTFNDDPNSLRTKLQGRYS